MNALKSVIVAFAAILLTIALPFVYQSIDNASTDEYTQTFAGIDTGAGAFTANVTLSKNIYLDDASKVKEISSNITSDTPSASSFNAVSHVLTVGGLNESSARTLAVVYYIESPSIEDFMITVFTMFRWFYIFLLIGMAGGAIYAFFD